MRLTPDGRLRLSPTDLANHLACPHLTQLELRVVRDELKRPQVVDAYGRIIMAKGNEHEAAHLARLEASGLTVARMLTYDLKVTTDIYGHWERAERKIQAAKMEGAFPV
jgi:hypothetical protein